MIAVAAVVILVAALCAIEARWPARPQRRWRRGMWTDLAFWLATPVIARVLAVVTIVLAAIVLAVVLGVRPDRAHLEAFVYRPTWFNGLPIAVQVVALLVGGDLLGYGLHRLAHRRRLWRFHKLHHSSVDLDWVSAVRVHPMDDLVRRAFHLIPFLALGFDARLLAAYVPVLQLYAVLLHANVPWTFGPLRYVIASPAFHRWHHSADRPDCNYAGLFPIWDLVFGTFHLPAEAPAQFGLVSVTSPQ